MAKKQTSRTRAAAAAPEAREPYLLTRADADRILDGWSPADIADAGRFRADGGTAIERVARHRLKWLPNADSETVIPLTAAEAADLDLD